MKKRILSAIIIATVVLGATCTPECYAIEEITPPLTKKELREQFKLEKKAKKQNKNLFTEEINKNILTPNISPGFMNDTEKTRRYYESFEGAHRTEIKKAVDCAKKAQKNWKLVPISKKVELLKIFLNKVDVNEDDLALTLSKETGKPITQAYAEIGNIRIGFEAFMEKAKHLYGNVIPAGTEAGQDKTIQLTVREPLGVMVAIIPFNFTKAAVNSIITFFLYKRISKLWEKR